MLVLFDAVHALRFCLDELKISHIFLIEKRNGFKFSGQCEVDYADL